MVLVVVVFTGMLHVLVLVVTELMVTPPLTSRTVVPATAVPERVPLTDVAVSVTGPVMLPHLVVALADKANTLAVWVLTLHVPFCAIA
jgi:hypothetical protein